MGPEMRSFKVESALGPWPGVELDSVGSLGSVGSKFKVERPVTSLGETQ